MMKTYRHRPDEVLVYHRDLPVGIEYRTLEGNQTAIRSPHIGGSDILVAVKEEDLPRPPVTIEIPADVADSYIRSTAGSPTGTPVKKVGQLIINARTNKEDS